VARPSLDELYSDTVKARPSLDDIYAEVAAPGYKTSASHTPGARVMPEKSYKDLLPMTNPVLGMVEGYRKTGSLAGAAQNVYQNMTEAPDKPTSLSEFATRNVPEDLAKTGFGLAAAPVQSLVGQGQAIGTALSGHPIEGAKQYGNQLYEMGKGIVEGSTRVPRAIFSEEARDKAITRPVETALFAYPVAKGAVPLAADLRTVAARGLNGFKTPAQALDATVATGIEKGIRPGVEGNRTFAQSQNYMGKAKTAVKSIIDNHENLALTDEYGEVVKGLPKNLKQFSQAIDQTKKSIFDQYDAMAKDSTTEGAVVDLAPVAKELNQIATAKVLNKISPQVADYAREKAKAFEASTFTTTEAQDAITMMNNNLEAFYKNPSYETASKAYIDSLVVNNLRKSLDSVIEQATGSGYQELKRTYGALKSIEKDVARRSIVDARKNAKGLIDFSDIFTSGEVVRGVMSMNPATVGAGLTSKVISALYKLKNDPNRVIGSMFKDADKIIGGKRIADRPLNFQEAYDAMPGAKDQRGLIGKDIGSAGETAPVQQLKAQASAVFDKVKTWARDADLSHLEKIHEMLKDTFEGQKDEVGFKGYDAKEGAPSPLEPPRNWMERLGRIEHEIDMNKRTAERATAAKRPISERLKLRANDYRQSLIDEIESLRKDMGEGVQFGLDVLTGKNPFKDDYSGNGGHKDR